MSNGVYIDFDLCEYWVFMWVLSIGLGEWYNSS